MTKNKVIYNYCFLLRLGCYDWSSRRLGGCLKGRKKETDLCVWVLLLFWDFFVLLCFVVDCYFTHSSGSVELPGDREVQAAWSSLGYT